MEIKIDGLWSHACFPAASALDINTVLGKLTLPERKMTKKRQSCRSFAYLVIKDNEMPSWRE